ncbi:hypothetical protein Nepgr_002419 [Nepenthes gracilis]|uniref:Uncharacterized protein n=1 Tax=Nepenthes gracilis TaxID=150966 RepID=A0AAD3P7U7_NEPGR|nr:hypothetical protein Nepgr_002419 [Nepenthes gracilis]
MVCLICWRIGEDYEAQKSELVCGAQRAEFNTSSPAFEHIREDLQTDVYKSGVENALDRFYWESLCYLSLRNPWVLYSMMHLVWRFPH